MVVICGHGSQSTNNPYASGLDCGACGGHAGDTNARLAANLLNDYKIREGLTKRCISIPSDTLFIAGLHNTTTDEVNLYDSDLPSSSDSSQLEGIGEALAKSGNLSLLERRATLGVESGDHFQNHIRARSRDWSQLRPEWGLAGNEAFIVAPRSWTQASDLKGKAFLHDYAPESDPEGARLEGILAGPLVVGSWINLQYFASAADNETYGSGQKMIHNVVGGIGVASGNENDLRVGLPWQSVHDGEEFVHRPCRLIACVSTEPHILEKILDKQSHLKDLVTNEWIHLVALGSKGEKWLKRGKDGEWYEKTTTPAHPIEELA